MLLTTAQEWQRTELFVAEEQFAYKAARPTVYLDTTIPSYLTAPMSRDFTKARRQRISRIWWSRFRPDCTVFISDLVLLEAADGRADASADRLKALQSVETFRLNAYSDALYTSLLGGPLPEKAHSDAKHIAIAATHSVRFLLTWNYKHLANRRIIPRVERMCELHNLRCPEICTPETMVRTYAYERSTH